jgi:hypothetical protein
MANAELCDDTIRFPVGPMGSLLEVRLFRTTTVPEDSQLHVGPRVLNQLPIRVVDDYSLGGELKRRGGVIVPMAAGDACRVELRARGGAIAVRVGTGKINIVNGQHWDDRTPPKRGDHLCVTGAIAIDGFVASCGTVRQFVAHPMGFGLTAEEMATGSAVWGGLQIQAIPMTRASLLLHLREIEGEVMHDIPAFAPKPTPPQPFLNGFGRGGTIEQQLMLSTFDSDAWDLGAAIRCFVTLMDHSAFEDLTGEKVARPDPPNSAHGSIAKSAPGSPFKATGALLAHLREMAKSKKE